MSRLVLSQITIKKERSISSTTWYYLLQPSNASAPDSTNYGNPPPIYSDTGYSGWSTTEPTYTVGDNRILYTMVQTLYSDNTFSYSAPTISSSYEVAKDAYNEVVQAEQDILELQELGLANGYVWDNMTYVAPTSTIPVYPIGSYIASGMLVNGSRTITRSNSNTYGLNTWISTGGINLRYNAIDLMKLTTSNLEFYYPSTSSQGTKAISLGTNGAINSLVFYGFNNSNKTMELTNNALNFYNPADGSTLLSSLTSNGLILSKGGIESGSLSCNGYVYLSTEDKTGITINGHSPGNANPKWRAIIGTKFGVDSEGNLYASDANINGIITINAGSNVYTIDEADNAFDERGAAYQAQTNAISAAAADATDKANVAQAAAELAAATDATNKANKAATTASNYIDDLGEGGTYIYSSNTQSKIQLSQNGIFLYNGNNIVAQYTDNIILGELGNIHIELSALEGLGFYQGRGLDNRVAYINQNKLFIEAAEIKNELRIGPFIWKVRDADTRISLRYEPRQEVNNG